LIEWTLAKAVFAVQLIIWKLNVLLQVSRANGIAFAKLLKAMAINLGAVSADFLIER